MSHKIQPAVAEQEARIRGLFLLPEFLFLSVERYIFSLVAYNYKLFIARSQANRMEFKKRLHR